jgi:hypothetical protein
MKTIINKSQAFPIFFYSSERLIQIQYKRVPNIKKSFRIFKKYRTSQLIRQVFSEKLCVKCNFCTVGINRQKLFISFEKIYSKNQFFDCV